MYKKVFFCDESIYDILYRFDYGSVFKLFLANFPNFSNLSCKMYSEYRVFILKVHEDQIKLHPVRQYYIVIGLEHIGHNMAGL